MSKENHYPGRLGQPTLPSMTLLAIIYLARTGETGDEDKWLDEYQAGLMEELLEFYEIDWRDNSKWEQLAYALARNHVPAFRFEFKRGPGRPKKLKDGKKSKRKKLGPGRDRKITDAYLNDLRENTTRQRLMLEQKTDKKVTDKAAIESYVREQIERLWIQGIGKADPEISRSVSETLFTG